MTAIMFHQRFCCSEFHHWSSAEEDRVFVTSFFEQGEHKVATKTTETEASPNLYMDGKLHKHECQLV